MQFSSLCICPLLFVSLVILFLWNCVLPPSQNKCSFRSWAHILRRGKKVESAHKTRRVEEEREIEIELYWKARTTLILGQILNPETTLVLGRREYLADALQGTWD